MKRFVQKAVTGLVLAYTTTACTYNVSMAHTSGTATDVIDDTSSNTPNVSPKITVPMTPGSSVEVSKT